MAESKHGCGWWAIWYLRRVPSRESVLRHLIWGANPVAIHMFEPQKRAKSQAGGYSTKELRTYVPYKALVRYLSRPELDYSDLHKAETYEYSQVLMQGSLCFVAP